jgi:hypothetical protein
MQAFPTHGLLLLERRLQKFRQNIPEDVHDLRHTFISRLAESQASDSTVMALAAHVSRSMMERYSHIRMEAKRKAVDTLSGADFEPGVAQNWAQFLVSEKSDESNSLKINGEPGRTRTCNPLISRVCRSPLFSSFFLCLTSRLSTVFGGFCSHLVLKSMR